MIEKSHGVIFIGIFKEMTNVLEKVQSMPFKQQLNLKHHNMCKKLL